MPTKKKEPAAKKPARKKPAAPPAPKPETFGETIKRRRFEEKMTQEDLAVLIPVSRVTITAIENGKSDPGFKSVQKIARALKFSLDALA